ncbi:MAG: iron-sulfur cluster assembly scaffold protein [Candidatus Zixiibacteriota bacterium]|nr:MAG: iron-sulfur cluster assembly scaffold protein [candidate division Zixibacteria bacterium]
MYNPTIMEHFMNPRNVGEIADPDGVGIAGKPESGDMMKMYLRIRDGRIVEAKHETFGSGVAIAVSSRATEMIIGMPVEEAYALTREDLSAALDGIPPEKMDCSNMAPDAIKAAIDDYRRRQQQ